MVVPFSIVDLKKEMNQTNSEELQRRIEKKGNAENLDFSSNWYPLDPSFPRTRKSLDIGTGYHAALVCRFAGCFGLVLQHSVSKLLSNIPSVWNTDRGNQKRSCETRIPKCMS
jgi:hypothetical protein